MDATDEVDDVDGHVPLSDDEFLGVEDEQVADDDTGVMGRAQVPEPDADWPDVGPVIADELANVRYEAPWWIIRGERIDATALSNRKKLREREFRLGGPAGYDSLWGFVNMDPVTVVPRVKTAKAVLDQRDFALRRLSMPRLPTLMVSVVIAAAAAFGMVDGSLALRLAASASSLVFGIIFVLAVLSFTIPPRSAAIGASAAAVACLGLSTVPATHATRWYAVLVGLAFAGAGLVVTALWPIARAWRIEQSHWKYPDVALVAALLEFGDWVELDPAPQDRRRAVAALDRAATRFELSWHRVNRTGIDVTDRQLRAWAGRIRAETRDLQRRFALGDPQTFALLMKTYELIQAIVNRWPLNDHEDVWVRHGSWRRPPTSTLARLWVRSKVSGRYARQCLLAGVIATAALLLLAVTVWSAVPAFIATHVSRDLGSVLNFEPAVRLFVATISLSLFAVAGRVFARRH